MDYYSEIKNELIDNELTKRAKDYSKNKSDLMHYYNVGKLLIEAQGGEERAKYGDGLIKEYSRKLSIDIGKGYSERNLKNMRKLFLLCKKGHALRSELSWTHYREIFALKNDDMINYYIAISIQCSLSYRQLHEKIKNNEYERLDSKTKSKLVKKEELCVTDFVKNPVIIKTNIKSDFISEKYLKKIILENITDFMGELGSCFAFVDSEYKIKIGNTFNYIDILLFNYQYNCFVVVELKVVDLKKEHIGQILVYMNYVDKHIKSNNHNKTIGIIICKKDNKLVLEYTSDARIFSIEYILI